MKSGCDVGKMTFVSMFDVDLDNFEACSEPSLFVLADASLQVENKS